MTTTDSSIRKSSSIDVSSRSTTSTTASSSNSSHEGSGSSGESNHNYNSEKEKRKLLQKQFLENFSYWDFVDMSKPWILEPTGSLGGYFDFVPVKLRVGPWSWIAVVYLSGLLLYLTGLTLCYYWQKQQRSWWNETDLSNVQYPQVFTIKWWYQVIAFLWMSYIMIAIMATSTSYRAWVTYTVQSWTSLTIRHLLCVLIPIFPNTTILVRFAEYMRFSCAVAHTVTFVLWNFAIMPFILLVALRNNKRKQRQTAKFFFSFRLVNLHFCNILFCLANIYWASPKRKLEYADFVIAGISMILYMLFYLGFLDRIGVHLYPVFSPRNGLLVICCWSLILVTYYISFVIWRKLLWPDEDDVSVAAIQ